ncbi:DUF295 domain-containing protein [Nocardia takedensis]|uniref:DUF295 domain-containing protein n=1 Tax=Nocardia takedensis TaxID=259390 RepID=UPI00059326E3|nr:DUF295 domain-containing protein [Nocardia takedensis]
MTSFALSPSRRDELAALLGDEVRLQVEYPKVAEYLDTAAALPVGDPDEARLLDLRMLHFLTGGASSNPYWDVLEPLVSAGVEGRSVGSPGEGRARLVYAQTVLQETYAYAVPSPETLEWIGSSVGTRGLCEIGAGRGYWAGLLAERGIDVRAFDSEPPDFVANPSFPEAVGRRAVWHPVEGLPDLESAWPENDLGDRVLFLCWPPGWGDPMSVTSLRDYAEAGGDHLIYIGEPRGGKTATDEFFDELADAWTLDAQDESFVSWWNLDDVAQSWRRRR